MKRLSALTLIAVLTGCTTAPTTQAPIITNSPAAEPTTTQVITTPANKPKLTAQQDKLLRSQVLAAATCHRLDMITGNQAARAIHSAYRVTAQQTGVVIERELQTEILNEAVDVLNTELTHPTTRKRVSKYVKPICDAINRLQPR